jgi:aryl-alcohol dehydrogenase-like predicted oxidoreductase
MLPIPGTSSQQHLEENLRAREIQLSDDEFTTLDRAGKRPDEQGAAAW